ncbi:hypothetical protein GFJ94_09325 [Flavobacterium sp. LMO8]|uniref:hypothetical protein n=1 Tax=Flavobacterium sp. LMO8 TaxID=2654244 RepID=UPI0012929BEC|nr:hypothetical protein [Flavobacterium sp. LMO8]MQP25264.1 hypothetical protein [Flavobacterium sp. LMO8]
MKKIFIISGSIIILFLMYLAFWFYSATDTKNVYLSGYVFDIETNKPIQNAIIKVENQRYESDNGILNYSEYFGKDNYDLKSDKNGFYEIKIPKSAFIAIEVKKDGYKPETGSDYSFKYMRFKTYLEKTNY